MQAFPHSAFVLFFFWTLYEVSRAVSGEGGVRIIKWMHSTVHIHHVCTLLITRTITTKGRTAGVHVMQRYGMVWYITSL